jgi:hypothetical protein
MSKKPGHRPDRQQDGEPVVEDEGLPRMSASGEKALEVMQAPERIIHDSSTATLAPPLHDDGPAGARMGAFSAEGFDREEDAVVRGEQRERESHQEREGYVRLRLRLEHGKLSVVGARHVEGPLAFDESLQGVLVYEVRAGERRLGIGSVPDAGEMRSFPPPEPREGQVGHHIVPLRATEFNVRVRAGDLKAEALDEVGIDVYSLKSRPERPRLTAQSLAAQLEQETRLVARLDSIELSRLEPRVREELKQATR